VLAGAAGFVAYAAACPRARVWAPGFHRGPREGRDLALTFDDGPSNETPRFLDLLAEYELRATFFVCGANVERRPELARRVVAEGHEIGNHTQNHPCLLGLPAARVREEVLRAQSGIEDATGVSPRLFRPPFGIRAPSLPAVLAEASLLAVHWTVIGNDWKWPSYRIAARVLDGAGPGGIICLHDGYGVAPVADRGETLDALEQTLPLLLHQGYRMVTASEMGAMLELRPESL
jgi:peptidoglycan/xylan/chitin deacetylase (PgdA/CDA1 family)